MNILFTSPTFHPSAGGAETALDTLTRELAARGHRVAVATSQPADPVPDRESRDGVEIHRLAYPPQRLGLTAWPLLLIRGIGLFLGLRRLARGMDVVCIGLVGIEAFLVLLLRRLAPFRLVVYLHGGELRRWVRMSPFMRRTLRACLRSCDAAIAVSAGLRDEAVAFEPRVGRKIHVIPNGIDPREFGTAAPVDHPRPYILYVGRLDPIKGLDTLIRAFRVAAPKAGDLQLLIAGAGPEEERLKALAANDAVASRITFLGKQQPDQIRSLLAGCEFLVLPSRSEGCPVVVLEAMAAGRMTIGRRVDGIAELIERTGAGVLYEPGHVDALADLIVEYHAEVGARTRLGDRARDASTAYDIADLASRHLEVYGGASRTYAIGVITCFYYRDEACAGLSAFYFNLARSLVDLGHEVYTVTTEEGKHSPQAGHVVTVPVARARLLDRAGGAGVRAGIVRVARRLQFAWTAYRQVRRLDRQHGLDVVMAPELFAQGLFAAIAMSGKLVTHVHTPTSIGDRYNDRSNAPATWLLTSLEWFQARRSRAVSVASEPLAAMMRDDWRIAADRLHRIPNSVPVDWVRDLARAPGPDVPAPYLLYFGRFERRKGVHVLAEALRVVLERKPALATVFIGSDGGLRGAIERARGRHAGRTFVFDAMDKGPLFAAIRGARLIVLPSLYENMSNAGLEAMALGRPVVGSLGTAFEEIIEDGVNGFLTTPGDAGALADKILDCLDRPDLDDIGLRALDTVRRFDSRAVASRHVELCARVVSG